MRRPQGYAVITDPYAPTREADTFTCCHCNRITFVKPPPEPMPGGFCRMCMKCICDACCDLGCTPFEKKLEQMEAQAALWLTL
jgi:hypothetical protein